jgi:hypothetical protein
MLRLLWAAVNQPSSLHLIPSQLLQPKPPRRYTVTLTGNSPHPNVSELPGLCRSFLSGDSDDLIHALQNAIPHADTISKAQAALHASDLETLRMFFVAGPKRNRTLLAHRGVSSPLILQDELDDLFVLAGPTPDQ